MPDGSGLVIPAWMFDSVVCASMKLGAPRVSLAALERVGEIVCQMGFDSFAGANNERSQENIDAKEAIFKKTDKNDSTGSISRRRSSGNRRTSNPSDGDRNIIAASITGRGRGRQARKERAK